MNATVTLTLQGDVPADVQVGDKLSCHAIVTVHSVTADLVDIRTIGGDPEWALGGTEIAAVANRVTFAKETA